MPKVKTATQAERQLVKEVRALSKEVNKLKNLEFVKVIKKPGRLVWLSFLKGIASGFGGVLGATVLVAFFIYILAQISFVPIIGDFIQDVQQQITEVPALVE